MTSVLTIAQAAFCWLASALAATAAASYWVPRLRSPRVWIVRGALFVLTLGVGIRWAVAGHPPIFGTYENSLAAAWFILAFLVISDSGRLDGLFPRETGSLLSLWLPVILGFGLFFERDPYPLTISERSLIVDLHVLFAWLAHTVLLATSTIAARVVFGRSDDVDDERGDSLVRGAGTGFALFTAMITVGSVYSYLLFADWFRWEIAEAFAAATWLVYGLAIHAALFFGWRDKRLAWVLLIALPLMLGTFWVWSLYSGTYHHFEIPILRAS